MKKILTHLTGIVFLITILATGGCSQKPGVGSAGERGKVEISCKAVIVNGEMHFEMWDSNDITIKVVAKLSTDDKTKLVANLVTYVKPRTRVVWKWVEESEVEKFVKISPRDPNGQIMTEKAKRVPLTKRFQYRIPSDAPVPSEIEKYDIEFLDLDGNPVTIDPYLEIPPPRSDSSQ